MVVSMDQAGLFYSKTKSNHEKANVITTTIGGGLSMIGVAFIALSYIKIQGRRHSGTTAEKILLCISASDFVSAATSVIGVWYGHQRNGPNTGCKAEGFFIIFSLTASFFWTSCLTIHLFLVMTRQQSSSATRKLLISSHIVCWGLPIFLASLALGFNALGTSPNLQNVSYIKLTTGGWCWIRDFPDKSHTVAWTLMTMKFWELLSYCLIVLLCSTILFKLRYKLNESVEVGESTVTAARKVARKMMFIPIAFILLRIWGTVRYFAYVSDYLPKSVTKSVQENITLYALQGLGDCSQGLANSIFFCISNKHVSNYWKMVFLKHCSFLCDRQEISDVSERTPLIHNGHNKTKELAVKT